MGGLALLLCVGVSTAADPVQLRLVADRERLRRDEAAELALLFTLEPGWRLVAPVAKSGGRPLGLEVTAPDQVEVGSPVYLPSFHLDDVSTGAWAWLGETAVFLPVHVGDRSPRRVRFDLSVTWEACRETCVQGETKQSLTVRVARRPGRVLSAHQELLAPFRAVAPKPWRDIDGATARWLSDEHGPLLVLELPGVDSFSLQPDVALEDRSWETTTLSTRSGIVHTRRMVWPYAGGGVATGLLEVGRDGRREHFQIDIGPGASIPSPRETAPSAPVPAEASVPEVTAPEATPKDADWLPLWRSLGMDPSPGEVQRVSATHVGVQIGVTESTLESVHQQALAPLLAAGWAENEPWKQSRRRIETQLARGDLALTLSSARSDEGPLLAYSLEILWSELGVPQVDRQFMEMSSKDTFHRSMGVAVTPDLLRALAVAELTDRGWTTFGDEPLSLEEGIVQARRSWMALGARRLMLQVHTQDTGTVHLTLRHSWVLDEVSP